MSKKNAMTIVTLFVILAFLLQAATPLLASQDRDWKKGDILEYNFEIKFSSTVTSSDEEDLSLDSDWSFSGSMKVKLVEINETTQTVNVSTMTSNGKDYEQKSFNSSIIGSYLADFFNFVWFSVKEDPTGQIHVAVSGGFFQLRNIASFYVIDPDWATVRDAFLETWDESRVIAMDFSSGQKLTFGDLLGNATSYRLMGKDNLADAKKELKDDTHSWSFEFDFSNYLEREYYPEDPEWRGPKYATYSKFIFKGEITYTSGGILDRISSTIESEIELDDGTTITETYSFSESRAGGGLLGGTRIPGFELVTVLLGLVAIAPIVTFRSKRKEK